MDETRTNRYKCFDCAFTMSVRQAKCPSCGGTTRIVDLKHWRMMTSHAETKQRRTSRSNRPTRPVQLMQELGIKEVK